jgi:Pyruvate/2-oxoacid:ferredoxin oxidoreductase gamma subunit
MILLGAASSDLGLARESLEEALRRTVKSQVQEINLRAFARGVELAELR